MSQTTMLITASISMLTLSLLVAGALFLLNHGPLLVIVGGTLAGIAVYVAVCEFGSKFVEQELHMEEEQNA